MSDWTSLVTRVVAQMQTITDIGQVYDRFRLLKNETEFNAAALSKIGGENRARLWLVSLLAMDTQFADQGGAMQWDRQLQIEGFLQIEDANKTEQTAIALSESIIRTLAGDLRATKLGGTVLFGKPPKLAKNEPRTFMGFLLCHYIQLVMPLSTIE